MAEYDFEGPVGLGDTGHRVRRVQEWLCLHGINVAIDGTFGPATQAGVREFQALGGVTATGGIDQATFDALAAPMRAALERVAPETEDLGALVTTYARQHLAQAPREVGGQNRGPWVRLYMRGNEGPEWPWCAGFVSFILKQASHALGRKVPIPWTASCDLIAAYAKERSRFVAEAAVTPAQLGPGTIFLNRRSTRDWDHTGLVVEANSVIFKTIEGNTNDDGDREGYEVCGRIRGYSAKDFVIVGT